MKVGGVAYRSIWVAEDGWSVTVIDQTTLPYEFHTARLTTLDEAADAIRAMKVRGAPLIGATAAYGVCLAALEDASDEAIDRASDTLMATRPTAVNLRWALNAMRRALQNLPRDERVAAAYARAAAICDEDVAINRAIGEHGFALIEQVSREREGTVNVLTHCNAGWLATVDHGTALAPIYLAHDRGIDVHVWVDETRPRNQGVLTAWELGQHGVRHTMIPDNAGGHLMQHGMVDLCITGTDRTTRIGDVCNKIGTYLKALAAKDNGVPFYVALPGPTVDWTVRNGLTDIPIEERSGDEVSHVRGMGPDGLPAQVNVVPAGTAVANHAFDVTPARLVAGLITERGICPATERGLVDLYPEHAET